MSEYPFNGAVDTEFTAEGPLATESKQDATVAQIVALAAQTPDGVEFIYLLRAGGQEFWRLALEWL